MKHQGLPFKNDTVGHLNGAQMRTPIKRHFPFTEREKTKFTSICAEKGTALPSNLSDPGRPYVHGVSVSRGGGFLGGTVVCRSKEKNVKSFSQSVGFIIDIACYWYYVSLATY